MDKAEGEILNWAPTWSDSKSYRILGVVEDVVMRSPYFPNMPTVYFLDDRGTSHLNIRIREGASASVALTEMEKVMETLFPDVPFTYEFADEAYAQKFAVEERIGRLSTVFALLAILISCLGLFGLAAYVAEQKTKEIGIRKVVGASVLSLWGLLTKEFALLVLISSLVSIPLAWYGMEHWLEDYEYRITLTWWVFAITIAGAMLVAITTVSFQAIRAALLNPVHSLRSE
jgi:ABC-type antimicrobial peptide transport system permease subunit